MSPDYEGQGHLDVGLVDGGYVDQPPAIDREGFAQQVTWIYMYKYNPSFIIN